MAGWIVKEPALIQVRPTFAPMVFNTAFLFAMISMGIILSDFTLFKIGRFFSIVVIAMASLIVLQYPLGFSVGVDQLFIKAFYDVGVTHSGRMAISTAISMILLGVALFFNKRTILCQYVRTTCATLVFGFGSIGFLGYVFHFNAEYGWGSFSRMAIHTSSCFMILSFALLLQLRVGVREDNRTEPRALVPFYMLVIGILTTVLIWHLLVLKDFDRNRSVTEIRADALKNNLDNSFYSLKTSLENMARRFALGRYKNYEMWALDSESFVDDFGGLKRITWADKNFITRWVYPLGNDGQKLLNLNIYTDPEVSEVVQRVVDTRQTALSNTFELKSGGRGFVLFTPVFNGSRFVGILSMAVIAKTFFERVIKVDGYSLRILENGENLVTTGKSDEVFGRDWTYRTRYQSLNANWEIVLTPNPELIRQNASTIPLFVLIFGVTISILLSLAVSFYQIADKAEKKIREALEWQRASRDSVSLLVLSTDANLIIRDVNASTRRVLEYSTEELVGSTPFMFIDKDEIMESRGRLEQQTGRRLDTYRAYAEAQFETGYNRAFERTLISKSGKRIHAVASISQVRNENGKIDGYMAIFEDVTQIRERENLLKEQEKMIVTSSRLASLGEMAAGIAHEINNPLAIISGYVGVLRKQLAQRGLEKDPEISKRVDAIDSTVDRIAKIVRGLRSYSRESHSGDEETVSLDTIIEDTLAFCHEKFKNAGVELESHIESNLMIKCRPYQISQVLLNLLNNAYDATETSAIRMVKIEAKRLEGGVEVSVADSGPGIPKNLREKIMQPFFTTKEVGHGIGLGLSISQGIIQGHGGKFYLDESAPNTRFVVWLPT